MMSEKFNGSSESCLQLADENAGNLEYLSSLVGEDAADEPSCAARQSGHFSAWVRWHGPYRSIKAWIGAAESFGSIESASQRFRLYMAIGRAKAVSIKRSQVLYVGMNGAKSGNLAGEIGAKLRGDDRKQFRGLFNEYWIGELLTQFDAGDDNHCGLSRHSERAIIYSIDPLQNYRDHMNPPEFSFRVINIRAQLGRRGIFKTQFEDLVCGYMEYDREAQELIQGSVKLDVKRQRIDRILRKDRKTKRKKVDDWWQQRFAQAGASASGRS